ncbi:MAG: hypothetical protein ACRDD8_14755 [Bacteroidales bacterium]
MRAKHVNISYEVEDFEELIDFLDLSIEDKVQYISENTEYVKNYILESFSTDIDVSDDIINKVKESEVPTELINMPELKDKVNEALTYITEILETKPDEEILAYIDTYIDTKDIPAFLLYKSSEMYNLSREWTIYINDDAVEVYQSDEFLQGIKELNKPNALVHIEDLDKGTPSYNIGYSREQLTMGDEDNSHMLRKIEHYKKIMGFLLFKANGIDLTKLSTKEENKIFDNTSTSDFIFFYKLNGEWHIYGNNENSFVYKANKLHKAISWVKHNHKQNRQNLHYNPSYKHNLKKVKTNLYRQRMSYLEGLRKGRQLTPKGRENKKPVVQLDKTSGYAIQTWPSASDASKALGITRTSITKVANGIGASAGGFGWKFA